MPEEFTREFLETDFIFGIVGLFSGGYSTGVGNPFSEWNGLYIEDPSVLNKRWISFEFIQ